jgi:hypothetical protein
MNIKSATKLWNTLEHKFSALDARRELYVDDHSIMEHAREFQLIAKELKQHGQVLPNKIVACGIITKLLSSWRNFATTLKHKRQ